jgi:hypothetical protein
MLLGAARRLLPLRSTTSDENMAAPPEWPAASFAPE